MPDLREQLIEAIEASGQTRYEIAQAAGIHWRVLDRFINADRDIKLSTAQSLCRHFGMRLTKARRNQAKG